MRLARNDFAMLAALNARYGSALTPEVVAQIAGRAPKPRLTEQDVKRLRDVNLQDVWTEYKQRVALEPENPQAVRTLTEVIEDRAPVNEFGNAAELSMDAFELQLAARGLMVRGERAALLSIFVEDVSNRVLFTEYIRRVLQSPPAVSTAFANIFDLVAFVETVPSSTVLYPKLTSTEQAKPLMYHVEPGADLPRIKFELTTEQVYMFKLGAAIELSYEVLRRMTMNLVTIYVNLQSENMQRQHAKQAVNHLTDGATSLGTSAAANTITHKEFIKAKRKMEYSYYNPTVVVYNETADGYLLDNDVFYGVQFDLLKTGRLDGVGGMQHKLIESGTDLGTKKLLYVDRNRGLGKFVEAGSMIAENDRFISNQTELFTFSERGALQVMDDGAAGVYTIQ